MAKLYFKYGAMGSSKTANLLMTKFNYEQKDMTVCLMKSSIDIRDGNNIIKSRIGLQSKVDYIIGEDDLYEIIATWYKNCDVIIIDEAQFLSEQQVNDIKQTTIDFNIPVICYGLLTDFQTHLFDGSKRLIELAESIQEIKTVCKCGKKATVNARISKGRVIKSGEQIQLGADESYESMCYECWIKN